MNIPTKSFTAQKEQVSTDAFNFVFEFMALKQKVNFATDEEIENRTYDVEKLSVTSDDGNSFVLSLFVEEGIIYAECVEQFSLEVYSTQLDGFSNDEIITLADELTRLI